MAIFRPVIEKILPSTKTGSSSQNSNADIANNKVTKKMKDSPSPIQGTFQYQDSIHEVNQQIRASKHAFERRKQLKEHQDFVLNLRITKDYSELDYLFGGAYDTYAVDRETEMKNCLRNNFLQRCNVRPYQRKQLLKWLLITFKSIKCFELIPEVHHLTVAILDRYIQAEERIPPKELKLVTIACLLIAIKMEDGLSTKVTLEDCAILTTCKYSRPEIADMEKKILFTLNFNLIIPSSHHFLSRCNLITKACEMKKFFGMYILEIGFSSYEICCVYPSLQAAAAHFIITAVTLEPKDLSHAWSPALRYYTEYHLSDLKPIVRLLAGELYRITKKAEDNIIFSKYADDKFSQVSKVVANSLIWIKKLKRFK